MVLLQDHASHVVPTPQFIVVLLQDHTMTMLYQHHNLLWCFAVDGTAVLL
jgi:hypothetical protein